MRKASPFFLAGHVSMMLEYVCNVIEEEGPFQGIIGISEGAMAAATFLIDYLEMCRKTGSPRMFKWGVFFIGGPPVKLDGKGWILSDESDLRITIPTCHVIGRKDPLALMSGSLWNVCDPKSRVFLTHERGHIIPHEPILMAGVAGFVRAHESPVVPESFKVENTY